MFDQIVFNPDDRPESQHQLRGIPESSRIGQPAIKLAIVAYEKAIVEERARRADFNAAEIELPAAQFRDEQALAASKSAGKKDGGPIAETKHLELIRECRRQHGASVILLGEAVRAVVATGQEFGSAYEVTLTEEIGQVRGVMNELISGWERSHAELQKAVANRSVARGSTSTQGPEYFAAQIKVPRIYDDNMIQISDVLTSLKALGAPVEPTTVASVQHRPLSAAPYASSGSSSQSLGRTVPDEQVAAWARKDAAEAEARGAGLSEAARAERLARADARKGELAEARDADLEAAGLAQ